MGRFAPDLSLRQPDFLEAAKAPPATFAEVGIDFFQSLAHHTDFDVDVFSHDACHKSHVLSVGEYGQVIT